MKKIIITVSLLLAVFLFAPQANAQLKITGFGILQGSVVKYTDDYDPLAGGSATGGIILNKHWGFGANVQVMDWGSNQYYIPLNFEASYFTARKFGPYFNIQIGKGFYRRTDTYTIPGFTSANKRTGGIFFSPGAGMLFPFFGKTNVILTASYIRSQFNQQIYIVGDPAPPYTGSYSLDGFKIALGFKI